MKQILNTTFLVLLALVGLKGYSQCTINTSNTNPGLTPGNLPCITPNVAYGQTQQIYIPAFGPGGITVDSAVFTGVTGLPAGLTAVINPANGRFLANSNGCVWVSGTTSAAVGSYPLTVLGTIYTSGGAFPAAALIQDTAFVCAAAPTGCTVDTTNSSPGLTPGNLPCITPNAAYGQTQQIYIPAGGPGGLTIDSARFTGVSGLPSGISYSISPANGYFAPNSHGCIWFSGTTTTPSGIFPLTIAGTIYTSGGAFPISAFLGDTAYICSSGTGPHAGFFAAPTNICAGANVEFNDTSTNATNYSWSFPGGTPSFSNAQSPVIAYNTPGNYSVTLHVSGSNGQDSLTRSNYIHVSAAPSVQVNSTPSTCGNSTGTAWAVATNGATPFTYSWSASGQTTDTITGLAAGSYTVTVTSNIGCTASGAGIVSNSNGPSITFTNREPLCFFSTNGSVVANVTGGATPYTYVWAGNSSTVDSISGVGAGRYDLTVTDHNGCAAVGSDSLSQPNFVSDFINTTPSTGSNGTAWGSPSGGTPPYTFLWSNNATTDTITGLAPGTYTITVTDSHGCTDQRSGTVGGTVGISDQASLMSKITVAPNPSNESFVVSLDLTVAVAVDIRLYDVQGQLVFSSTESNGFGKISKRVHTQAMPTGIYILELRANGEAYRTRVSIAH